MQYAGKWNDILFAGLETYWLYNKGNEFTARTGGWNISIGQNGAGVKNSNFIKLYAAYQSTKTHMETNTWIDLTAFSRLIINMECISEVYVGYIAYQIFVTKENGQVINIAPDRTSGLVRQDLFLDITSISGNCKISIVAVCNDGRYYSTVNVYSVRLA